MAGAVGVGHENGSMTNTGLVTARDLDVWCTDERSPFTLPIIIRQLILATAPVAEITMPARVGVRQRGWDGLVRSGVSDPHVPRGLCGGELGTGAPPRDKAQGDYRNRTRNPCGVDPVTTTFVAVTSRIWPEKTSWRDARRRDGRRADVRARDALDLEIWMERVPSAHVRISEILGREPRDARTPGAWWTTWSRQTDPVLPRTFLLAGRDAAAADLTQALPRPPQVFTVTAASQAEALAVVCASLVDDGSDVAPFRARALVVSGEGAWGRLVDAAAPLVLIPAFEEPDVTTALDNGHHVVVPVSRDVPPHGHLVAVPALDHQAAAEAFLSDQPGPGRTRAGRYAAHARRNMISFRRTIARIPTIKKPSWAQGEEGRRLAPLVLAGAWSDETEGDREAIEALTCRTYDEVEGDLAMWSAQEDTPVYRSGRTWRLVSRDDVWDLVSPLVTRTDLDRFHTVADRVLREPDPALDVGPRRRFMAAVIGEPPRTRPGCARASPRPRPSSRATSGTAVCGMVTPGKSTPIAWFATSSTGSTPIPPGGRGSPSPTCYRSWPRHHPRASSAPSREGWLVTTPPWPPSSWTARRPPSPGSPHPASTSSGRSWCCAGPRTTSAGPPWCSLAWPRSTRSRTPGIDPGPRGALPTCSACGPRTPRQRGRSA